MITTLSLLIGFISLDHTAVGQFMCSQPLVGGWLLGAAAGEPLAGLTAGALLQFLCLAELPVGASIPPDGSLAGLVGVALTLTAPRPPGWGDAALLGLAVLLFFPLAYLSRGLEVAIRRGNAVWTRIAEREITAGRYGRAQLATLGGIPIFFAKAFFFSWLVLRVFSSWSAGAGEWTVFLAAPLAFLGRAAPFLALGSLAAGRRDARSVAVLAFGFLLAVFFTWNLR